MRLEEINSLWTSFNPFTPKSEFIDIFTLSNARRFYSSKGDPLGVKGLAPKSDFIDFTNTRRFYLSKGDPLGVKALNDFRTSCCSPPSETQGQLVGVGKKSNWARKKIGKRKNASNFFLARFDFFPPQTNCPWVSEDGCSHSNLFFKHALLIRGIKKNWLWTVKSLDSQ